MEPVLLEQIPILEDALRALGVTVWAMEKYEADDALASAVRVACEDHTVHKVFVLTPDKDLGQVVQGKRVVQMKATLALRAALLMAMPLTQIALQSQ